MASPRPRPGTPPIDTPTPKPKPDKPPTPCNKIPYDYSMRGKRFQTGCRFHFKRILYAYRCGTCNAPISDPDTDNEKCSADSTHPTTDKHREYRAGYLFACPTCGSTEQRNY